MDRIGGEERPIVVLSFLGTQLDEGRGRGRWQKWRPNVDLTRQGQAITRLELFYTVNHRPLAELIRTDIAEVSPTTEVRLQELVIADPWDFGEVYGVLYDWVSSYHFDTEHESYWAHITTGTHVAQICMFLLVEARFIPGVLLQTSPPRRQREENIGTSSLIDLDLSRYDGIARRFEKAQSDAVSFLKRGIATRNPRFNALIEEIERVAVRSRAPILLVGPTGAGKSMLAKRMYELKRVRHQTSGPFVEVNCATLRGDGAASALFGHRKGAFTGAATDRAGLLRSADQGVLFLDEIGELGLDEQAMLLTAIEEKRFLPVGADKEVASNFQLIAGSNRDLRRDVVVGRFREDLFARINLWTYDLPSLAERPEDIEPNVEHLLQLASADVGRAVRFNLEARQRYVAFAMTPEARWSGNFRDLSASVTRLATLAQSGRISLDLVDAEIARLRWLWRRDESEDLLSPLLTEAQREALDLFDRTQLETVVNTCRTSASLSEAGRKLFAASRVQRRIVNDADRLRKYLAKWGLCWDDMRSPIRDLR